METFDGFLDKAKNMMNAAGKKTSEAVEIARLKMNRMQINGDIQKTYEKLGAFVYKFKKTGEENQELVDICISEIDGLLEQLNDIADKINAIKATVKCPECGAINDEEAIYCSKCGARMAQEEPEEGLEKPCCCSEEGECAPTEAEAEGCCCHAPQTEASQEEASPAEE